MNEPRYERIKKTFVNRGSLCYQFGHLRYPGLCSDAYIPSIEACLLDRNDKDTVMGKEDNRGYLGVKLPGSLTIAVSFC